MSAPCRLLLLYWGRQGALNRLALQLAHAAHDLPWLVPTWSISRQGELFHAFAAMGSTLFPVTTFESSFGAMTGLGRLPALRRALAAQLRRDRTEAVIALMPHVWSQLVIDTVHQAGARYVTIVHDAVQHPGDKSRRLHQWLIREAAMADHVVTLSRAVATQLVEHRILPWEKTSSIFLPDIDYGCAAPLSMPETVSRQAPLRLLFFGRVLTYKGLPLLLDAIERVQRAGIAVSLGVWGLGDLSMHRARLDAIGAEVVNRWIAEDEVAAVFGRYHAVVLSHTESSQSGVAAAAFGAGVPVIALPVGGIVEQVCHGENGLLADAPDAASLADAIARLAAAPSLHQRLCAGIARTRPQRSTTRFLTELAAIATAADRVVCSQ